MTSNVSYFGLLWRKNLHPLLELYRCTWVIQKVRRVTHLMTRYAPYILSLFNIISCNWNALCPSFLQSSNSTVEELLILLFQPAIFWAYNNVFVVSKFAFFHEFLPFGKETEVNWSHLWQIWWVTEQFEAGISDGSQYLRWRVNMCIVLVKQHSMP